IVQTSTSHVICNDDNSSTSSRLFSQSIEKQNVSTLTNIVSEGTTTVIEPVKVDLDPPKPQQFVETNRMSSEVEGETLNSADESETTAIPAQQIDLSSTYDEPIIPCTFKKVSTITN